MLLAKVDAAGGGIVTGKEDGGLGGKRDAAFGQRFQLLAHNARAAGWPMLGGQRITLSYNYVVFAACQPS